MKRPLIFFLVISILASCKDDMSNAQIETKAAKPNVSTLSGKAPLIIGHRGAPGFRPDHTLESYQLAIDQGADFIEPDLVLTKDSVLVCRHEPMLSGTTNVADLPQFASKKTTKMVDGVAYEDWLASDFTLKEIRTLKAKQPMADRPQQYNGLYCIPTFQEVIDLAKKQSAAKGRIIGIYPETKHPTFHERDLKLPLTQKVLQALKKAGWDKKESPVFVQSFEVSNLQYLRKRSTVKIVQLLDADDVDENGNVVMKAPYAQPYYFVVSGDKRTFLDLTTEEGLAFVKTYADGIGPWKPYIQPYNKNMEKLPATDLIKRAHKKELLVHAYTFRNESRYLLKNYNNDPKEEYKNFFKLGIDGVFSDYAETAVAAKK